VASAVVLDQNLRSWRHRECQRLPLGAVPKRTLTVSTSTGLEVRPAPVALEVTQGAVAYQYDVAPVSAVSTVGTASGHVSFAAEAEASVASAAGADENPRAIEHAPIVEERASPGPVRPPERERC
jgi:hypothetical protein